MFVIPYFRLWSQTDGHIDGQRCMLLPQVLGTTCTTLLAYLYLCAARILNIYKIVTLFDIKRNKHKCLADACQVVTIHDCAALL